MAPRDKSRTTGRKVLATVVVLAAVAAFLSFGVYADFSTTVSNSGSSLTTGTLSFNDSVTSALFSLTDFKPGDFLTKCVRVTNTGSLPASVTATPSFTGPGGGGNDLSSALLVKVEEGSGLSGNTSSCTGFSSSSYVMGTNSSGVAPSAMTTATYSSWASGSEKDYRITVTMPSSVTSSSFQNATSNVSFSWSAAQQPGGDRSNG
jgi:hypothetical protein